MHRLLRANLVALLVAVAAPLAAQAPMPPASRSAAAAPRAPRSATRAGAASATTSRGTASILPGTRANVFTTIQGNALNWNNGALANAFLRLRDARFGRIVDTTNTDKAGLFTFQSLDPGSYIVEIISQDTILAASQIIHVNAGEAVSAVVKLPFRFAGTAGMTAANTITDVVNAAQGVMTLVTSGQPVSPQR